jgi:two-component system, NarL family, nitrate/nitrite response regulator NarL
MRTVMPITDEPVVAEGFRRLIEGSGYLLLNPLSFDTQNLSERLLEARPHVVLLNWNPDLSLTAVARVCGNPPPCPIILVARNPSPELVYQAQEAGFSGMLDSRCSREEILSTLERCERDDFAFDYPEGMELHPARAVHLSPREGQLVRLLTQGLKNKEIATCLGITEGTVKFYLSHLFKKVGAKDRFELALFGLKNMAGAEDGATRSVASCMSANGRNHVAGLRTLVLSESIADDDDDDLPYRSVVSNVRVNATTPIRMGLRSTRQVGPARVAAGRS